MNIKTRGTILTLSNMASAVVMATALPPSIERQIPRGYEGIIIRDADFNNDNAKDFLVIAGSKTENKALNAGEPAPRRWLLAFIQTSSGAFNLAGKNQFVALAADQGGQCDPLLDSGGVAVKGPYFTVENSVACGEHWTDYITFKFNQSTSNFLFHKRIVETWESNPSNNPNAEALIRQSRKVTGANQAAPISLDNYTPQ